MKRYDSVELEYEAYHGWYDEPQSGSLPVPRSPTPPPPPIKKAPPSHRGGFGKKIK